jgi:hypothetical protein
MALQSYAVVTEMLDCSHIRGAGLRRDEVRRLKARLDLCLDAALFVAFACAYSLGFTGLSVHEWLGLSLGTVLLVHLTSHWDWVIRTTVRMARRRGPDRFIYVVNVLLLLTMTLCIASGIAVSEVALPDLGIHVPGGNFWSSMHSLTARLTLALLTLHVGLRWRWIVSVVKRMFSRPARADLAKSR